jgi:SH3 domain protein
MDAGVKVQVVARDVSGGWFQILYPASSQGLGWVTAQFVTIPVGTQVPLQSTSTPAGPSGRLLQRVNVRSGPGTSFNLLGLLEANTPVLLTGKNNTASWFQIMYQTGPGGRGWITAQYVQTDAAGDLPVLDDFGAVVTPGATGNPSAPDLAPTSTIGPALTDGDSSTSPAINVTFSPIGTRRFIYSSQVSTPMGDAEDWVAFTPFSATGINARLLFSLTCSGNGSLTVNLLQGGTQLSGWGSLVCGDFGKALVLPAGQPILLHLVAVSGERLQFVAYTLDVQNNP